MAPKCRENKISRQIQDVMTSYLVNREKKVFSERCHKRSFIADHFLLKDNCDKKKYKARNHCIKICEAVETKAVSFYMIRNKKKQKGQT